MFEDKLRATSQRNRFLAGLLAGGLALGFTAQAALADDDDEFEFPFDEAEIFFELNNTDEDLGIHALIDGDAWKRLEIEDPNERKLLDIRVKGRLRKQGLTEIFFESAEPTFDELSPEEFFERFPAGTYEIEGKTLDGRELESETEVTHLMPAPPGGITLNGDLVILDLIDCDEIDTIPMVVAGPVMIGWGPVTRSHPGEGFLRPIMDVDIHNYQVVVEVETSTEQEVASSVDLPPDQTSTTIPAAFIALDYDGQIKYEVLAREESFNQTAVESCFLVQ